MLPDRHDVYNTPIGKPKRRFTEPAPITLPTEWPEHVVPEREPNYAPAPKVPVTVP